MKIERHSIDQDLAKELFDRAVDRLPRFLASAKEKAKNLDLMIDEAMKIVSCGSVVAPDSPQRAPALRLAAQAYAAFFAAIAATPSSPVEVTLGDERVTYTAPPDESTTHVGRWIKGFYCGMLCRDNAALELLCRTDPESLRASSTRSPRYDYLYARALLAWRTGSLQTLANDIIAALDATNPDENDDVVDSDWSLYLIGHQLEVLMHVVTEDAAFEGGLVKALEHHKKYWSKTKDRKRNYDGYVSIELSALAAQATDRGMSFDVESPYLVTALAG
jgi:hypothetical protein